MEEKNERDADSETARSEQKVWCVTRTDGSYEDTSWEIVEVHQDKTTATERCAALQAKFGAKQPTSIHPYYDRSRFNVEETSFFPCTVVDEAQTSHVRIVIQTTRDRVRGVADDWMRAYSLNLGTGDDKDLIWRALRKLDLETCSREDVDTLIGNRYWTHVSCGTCGAEVDAAAYVGDNERLCLECAKKIVRTLAVVKGDKPKEIQ